MSHCDNHSDSQIEHQETRKWFNKILTDLTKQNMLQITNESNKEQIIDWFMEAMHKAHKISVITSDGMTDVPIGRLAIHSPVFKEWLDCERDLEKPFEISVTTKTFNTFINMLNIESEGRYD